MLHTYNAIFVQNELSKSLLGTIGFHNVSVAGDTRFDRVKTIMHQSKEIPLVELFSRKHFVIVAGSTWEKDEDLLFAVLNNTDENVKLVMAPHEINKFHLTKIKNRWNGQMILYSEATPYNILDVKLIVIDNVGMLSSLYKYGQVAYVGGGFGKGIHNILEAATYGMPVIFGPKYRKFQEATQLVELESAFAVQNEMEFTSILNRCINDDKFLKDASEVASEYVTSKTGATDFVISVIKKELIQL